MVGIDKAIRAACVAVIVEHSNIKICEHSTGDKRSEIIIYNKNQVVLLMTFHVCQLESNSNNNR